jgi:lysophospholipase L1-like esterase
MKKKIIIGVAITVVSIVAVEIYMRSYWGFCDTVLTRESNKYEYIAQPNQDRFRFRKHVRYNEYSMRSDGLKSSDSVRILGFGDSVLNGGVQTEQDSLATSIIENALTNEYSKSIRCLNISYGSWAPDNCFAYVQEYGDFDADLIFLVVSSHDAHDNMDFRKVIDVHPSYPSRQYKSAVYELFDRYLIPKILQKKEAGDHIVKGNIFNPGFLLFHNYTQNRQIPFFIYLHPDRQEVREGKYDEQGEKIIEFCTENHISLLQGIEYENDSSFRDGIHLNEHGQRILADPLSAEIKRLLKLQ